MNIITLLFNKLSNIFIKPLEISMIGISIAFGITNYVKDKSGAKKTNGLSGNFIFMELLKTRTILYSPNSLSCFVKNLNLKLAVTFWLKTTIYSDLIGMKMPAPYYKNLLTVRPGEAGTAHRKGSLIWKEFLVLDRIIPEITGKYT